MSIELTNISGVGPSMAETLKAKNIDSVKKLAKLKIKELTSVPGVGEITGQKMIQAAKDLLVADKAEKKGKKKLDKKDKKKGKKDKKGKKNKK